MATFTVSKTNATIYYCIPSVSSTYTILTSGTTIAASTTYNFKVVPSGDDYYNPVLTHSGGGTWSTTSEGTEESYYQAYYSIIPANTTITVTSSSRPKYTVTLTAGAGGSVSSSSYSAYYNSTYSVTSTTSTQGFLAFYGPVSGSKLATITAAASDNYKFNAWSSTSGTITAARTISASFRAAYTYTVSYDKGDATSGSAPASQTKTEDVILTLRGNTGGLDKVEYDTGNTVTYTFDPGSGSTTKTSQSVTSSLTYNYTINGWSTTKGSSTASYSLSGSYSGNAALSLYPSWTYDGSTTTWPSITTPTTSECTRSGYTLKGWDTSSSATTVVYTPGSTITLSGTVTSKTLYAVWEVNTYTVTFTADTGGSVNPPSISVPSGTTYSTNNQYMYFSSGGSLISTVTATASTGYSFSSWSSSKGTITSNTSITVHFSKNTYLVTLNKGTGVSTIYYKVDEASTWSTYSSAFYAPYDSDIQAYCTADTGYSPDYTASDPMQWTMGTSAVTKTLTASIKQVKVYGVVASGSGTITGSGITVDSTATWSVSGYNIYITNGQTSYIISATAGAGYYFSKWTPTGSGIIGIDGKTFYAYFLRAIPDYFSWTNTIATGQPITNLTASDWRALQDKIDEINITPFTWAYRATSGGTITADMFNEVRSHIIDLDSSVSIVNAQNAGNTLKALYFETATPGSTIWNTSLRGAVNWVIDQL